MDSYDFPVIALVIVVLIILMFAYIQPSMKEQNDRYYKNDCNDTCIFFGANDSLYRNGYCKCLGGEMISFQPKFIKDGTVYYSQGAEKNKVTP